MREALTWVALAFGAVASGGCGSSESAAGGSPACVKNATQVCACVGGQLVGAQSCLADGSGWSACDCPDSGAGGGDAAVDAISDASVEANAPNDVSVEADGPSDASVEAGTVADGEADAVADGDWDAHVESCTPGEKRCGVVNASQPQQCDATGRWQDLGAECAFECVGAGACGMASCVGGATGQRDCGPGGNEDCCTSLLVPGGTVQLDSTHSATVGDYRLDKYEVSVGRFRGYVDAVVGGWLPPAASGKHAHLNGGRGLSDGNGGYEPGWDVTWNSNLPIAKATWDGSNGLACDAAYQTWMSAAGVYEKRPINCVNWYQTAAFCIWDGGFLPSEAEWQYAAAGGSENRTYPWGSTVPGANVNLAVYGCYRGANGTCSGVANIGPVGSVPAGNGRWGHSDLAGNVLEWTLDWYLWSYGPAASANYANVTDAASRVFRGGAYYYDASALLASYRYGYAPAYRRDLNGARCARVP